MTSPEYFSTLSNKIENRTLKIAVVGLGYVGLPAAIAFHRAGYHVAGIDSSKEVIDDVKSGKSPIIEEIGIEIPQVQDWILTTDYVEVIPNFDLTVVCVPTPIDNNLQPNLSLVHSAMGSIINSMDNDGKMVIILESTVQPGTTVLSVNEAKSKRPNFRGEVMIAYCPERVSPGEGGYGVSDVDRVIGSESSELTQILAQLYATITDGEVHPVSSIGVAEASKLVENAQRDIDIAFTNELAILLPKLGLDVEEVLEASSTKWNFHRHTPGIGVGGHCIPIDPHYYIEIAKRNGVKSALSPAAREMNASMPSHNANEVVRLCGGRPPKRPLILGFSYKPNVSDCRETPVLPLAKALLNLGSDEILLWDPVVDTRQISKSVTQIPDPYLESEVDCIIVATAHDEVINIDWPKLKNSIKYPRIFDGRRCLDPKSMIRDGWTFHAVGRPLGGN